VYFVHNRVESIFSIGNLLQRLVPEAKIVVGHGQMGEEELERAMLGFVDRQFDVLLATTIRRERPRYSECEHHHHQPRRSVRPLAAVSVARPCRPLLIDRRMPIC
jgi:hypothetical protein